MEEAIDKYIEVAKAAFAPGNITSNERRRNINKALIRVVIQAGLKHDAKMLDDDELAGGCKTLVRLLCVVI